MVKKIKCEHPRLEQENGSGVLLRSQLDGTLHDRPARQLLRPPDERERNGRARGQFRRKEEMTDSEGMHKGW